MEEGKNENSYLTRWEGKRLLLLRLDYTDCFSCIFPVKYIVELKMG